MADNLGGLDTPEQLIQAYQNSLRQRSIARRCISLAILAAIVTYAVLIWNTFLDFKNNNLPEFGRALSSELTNIAPQMTSNIRGMVSRLYPQYESVFKHKAAETWPRMELEIHSQLNQLEDFATGQWPNIQQGILQIAQIQEGVVMGELKGVLAPEDVEKIGQAYGDALKKKYDEILSLSLGAYTDKILKNANSIGTTLSQMADKEKDAPKPTDMMQIVGMMLELAGLQLQQAR